MVSLCFQNCSPITKNYEILLLSKWFGNSSKQACYPWAPLILGYELTKLGFVNTVQENPNKALMSKVWNSKIP